MMRLINALACFAFASSMPAAVSQAAAEAMWTQEVEAPKSSVNFYDVQEMPLTISDATLHHVDGGLILKCSASNRSPVRLLGARLVIIVVDGSGKLRSRVGWMEHIALEGYSAKEFSIRLPLKLKAAAEDRPVLAIEQVIGRESIWSVVNAKEAFAAYATGARFVAPDVRRVSNQGDFSSGTRIIFE